jgi:UDP-N-acetylglucosamine pyrophosphorylase
MEEKYTIVKEKLKKYNQEHLLVCYDKLIEQQKEELLDQILQLDFVHLDELYQRIKKQKDFNDCEIEPLPYIDKQKIPLEEKERYEQEGIKKIKEGKYAVVTMAGGQGTRLRT